MRSIRRWVIVWIAFTAACDSELAPAHRRGLERGRDAARHWIAAATGPAQVTPSTAVAAGYLERLRLGLGSPFRLADHALQDARLDPADRRDLAWAILARTLDRDAYSLDPHSLAVVGRAIGGDGGGRQLLDLIDEAIRESADPRAAELAVRRAYSRAAADGVVAPGAAHDAARVAALLRDRELAAADVGALLRVARQDEVDPLELLSHWRTARRFAVETPTMFIRSQAALAADEVVVRLTRTIRQVASKAGARSVEPDSKSLLGHAAARKLADLAEVAGAPPQAAIVLALVNARARLLDEPPHDGAMRRRLERFIENAVTEERFVAESALLGQESVRAVSSVGLDAAVALRAYAQEPVWFPGFPGPAVDEVEARYGLAEIRLADDVSPAWRPYYTRMLDLALADLLRVLPALDLSGLRILIATRHAYGATYAIHEPRRRRIVVPTRTGAGAIAHEIAHDLDWQVALHRYGIRGDYASDIASRGKTDPLSLRLRELTAASRNPGVDGMLGVHAGRPAEILARNVDWFVAVALAAQGRSNGYLTSIQDDLLTGFGSARPPDASGAAGETLIAILDELAPVRTDSRGVWLARYGRSAGPPDRITGIRRAAAGPGSAIAALPPSN